MKTPPYIIKIQTRSLDEGTWSNPTTVEVSTATYDEIVGAAARAAEEAAISNMNKVRPVQVRVADDSGKERLFTMAPRTVVTTVWDILGEN